MTDRPTDLSSLPSIRLPRRGLFSARKFALMASVVAGLGVAAYGLSPQGAPLDLFTTSAHAQVANEVSKVARPVGFADIVDPQAMPGRWDAHRWRGHRRALADMQHRLMGRFGEARGRLERLVAPPIEDQIRCLGRVWAGEKRFPLVDLRDHR